MSANYLNPKTPDLFPLRPIPHDADVVIDPYVLDDDEGTGTDTFDLDAEIADILFVSARARDWVRDLIERSAQHYGEDTGGLNTPDCYLGRPLALTQDMFNEMMRAIPPHFTTLMLVLEGHDMDGPDEGHMIRGEG